ncbi:GNAT family N-acetyltransferase [Mycoavidus cysteinexigens]|uniref:GNAT family N-acetyltransferase n=1 Tax=Mycoavidus cysteinexigens TaxID=1553431 RepID=UPI001E3F7B83|nr:N-acetyltransferase [Mycoavidus cysteinexigens]
MSPVTLSSGATGWYGLGPISVRPERQGQGIGSKLMKVALAELQRLGGLGCVVLGNLAYYGRFGFKAHPGLVYDNYISLLYCFQSNFRPCFH